MPFEFPLATVLRIRESREKREERALQKLQLDISRVSHQIEELSAEITRAHDVRDQAMRRPIAASQLHSLLGASEVFVEKRKALLHQLQMLEQEREQQTEVYRSAHRDREMLTEMLTEQQGLYEQEQVRIQQKSLDDVFMARRHRR
jgi:flagellar export protein FliJ